MRFKKFLLLLNTIRYLRIKQIFYRVFYLARKKLYAVFRIKPLFLILASGKKLLLDKPMASPKSYIGHDSFLFLNLQKSFDGRIEWDYSSFGKLWTYNLNYFDFLLQDGIQKNEALRLINDFCGKLPMLKNAVEPYPISLRGINWIKFFTVNGISDARLDASLYAQYKILSCSIEYHLLGNHLLENGFSLLFAAYYFEDEEFYALAKKILETELEEQILKDGGHFELSPMYHKIMLQRALDCLNLVKNNGYKNGELLGLLMMKAALMLGWLENMSFKNGETPHFNDSAEGIAPSYEELFEYADRLGVQKVVLPLEDSGYRKFENGNYEIIVDVGNIGPDYILGHAHSDTFNFELYTGGKRLIVDAGTSTYELGELRIVERSTASHNTVMVGGFEQSEVWGSFRVGKRAKIISLVEEQNKIIASHDGYQEIGVIHEREFLFLDSSVVITDSLKDGDNGVAFLHFAPDLELQKSGDKVSVDKINIHFNGAKSIDVEDYSFASGFNKRSSAKVVIVEFDNTLHMEILV